MMIKSIAENPVINAKLIINELGPNECDLKFQHPKL